MSDAPDPKRKFITTAHALFAARGFAGVSLADVAAELGVTKQAIIYHFRSKEALYGAVLAEMAGRLEGAVPPDAELSHVFSALHDHLQAMPEDAQLIARELLDGPARDAAGKTWYLRGVLDRVVALMAAHQDWRDASADQRAIAAYQWIGAIGYFAISGPTLTGIWGEARYEAMQEGFLDALLGGLFTPGGYFPR